MLHLAAVYRASDGLLPRVVPFTGRISTLPLSRRKSVAERRRPAFRSQRQNGTRFRKIMQKLTAGLIYLAAPVLGALLAVLSCRCVREEGCCPAFSRQMTRSGSRRLSKP